MALNYYSSADLNKTVKPYPDDAFFAEALTWSQEEAANVLKKLTWCLFFTCCDSLSADQLKSYRGQFIFLVSSLDDSYNSQWLLDLMKEMLEANAAEDANDARNHLLTVFCGRAFGEPVQIHPPWNTVMIN